MWILHQPRVSKNYKNVLLRVIVETNVWFNMAWLLKDGSIYITLEISENWGVYKSRDSNKVNEVLN